MRQEIRMTSVDAQYVVNAKTYLNDRDEPISEVHAYGDTYVIHMSRHVTDHNCLNIFLDGYISASISIDAVDTKITCDGKMIYEYIRNDHGVACTCDKWSTWHPISRKFPEE